MFDLLTRPADPSTAEATLMKLSPAYRGPERRAASSIGWLWLAAALDEIDYGLLMLDEDALLMHANRAARAELDAEHPLQLLGRELRARDSRDVPPLHAALHDALRRGLRKLLTLGQGTAPVGVSVVPLPPLGSDERGAALVILGKRQVSAELALQGFARSHRLTSGETRVLAGLCRGETPAAIAAQHGVAICTVRSQIGSIRQKTGAPSIRALLRQVAVLPPLMGVLRTSLLAA
ncbi:MAG: helix-turn-helix transcriptional regulator [Piscinibacter sp.]|nr:helix-turn-helix transcriptional regulator [Piscinibacter sp.]